MPIATFNPALLCRMPPRAGELTVLDVIRNDTRVDMEQTGLLARIVSLAVPLHAL